MTGAISASANSRAVRRASSCSAVSSKSIACRAVAGRMAASAVPSDREGPDDHEEPVGGEEPGPGAAVAGEEGVHELRRDDAPPRPRPDPCARTPRRRRGGTGRRASGARSCGGPQERRHHLPVRIARKHIEARHHGRRLAARDRGPVRARSRAEPGPRREACHHSLSRYTGSCRPTTRPPGRPGSSRARRWRRRAFHRRSRRGASGAGGTVRSGRGGRSPSRRRRCRGSTCRA